MAKWFWSFFGILNFEHKKVAPGNSLNFSTKKPNIDIWVPKMRFSKMYIFRAWYGIFLICKKHELRAGLITTGFFGDLTGNRPGELLWPRKE